MAIELELTAPVMMPKTIMDPVPTPVSAASLVQCTPFISYVADPSSPPMHVSFSFLLGTQLASILAGTVILKQKAAFEMGFKGKEKAKALIASSEHTGAKQAFKLKEVVDSDSDKEEEKRVCVIKKIKREHVKEPIGTSKGKETIELQVTVVTKMPMVGPLCQTLKPLHQWWVLPLHE
ncbi:hypothetical protein C0995_007499 [Termitomyces sp. Mi166|nr:hypothetical protein C0995_007499 [Termitomyces sp. Mi166\